MVLKLNTKKKKVENDEKNNYFFDYKPYVIFLFMIFILRDTVYNFYKV